MDSRITAAVEALETRISKFLGDPVADNDKMLIWERGKFEVAVQRDVGPHVWLSADWRPSGQPFRDIADSITRYPADQSRHSGLNCTQTLGKGNAARCIKNVGDRIDAVVRCVYACAEVAGAIDPPEMLE